MADMSPELRMLDDERRRLEQELQNATRNESHWEPRYKKEWARAFLEAEGSEQVRKCKADLAASPARERWREAEALRRSATAANEALTAIIHAYNREIKVEADMSRSGGGYGA